MLFETLAGRSPFDGETITDVLGAIVHKEPDLTKLPAQTPDVLRRLISRSLTKDRRQRLHHIGDARLELEDLLSGRRSGATAVTTGFSPAVTMPMTAKISTGERLTWSLAGTAATLVAMVVVIASGAWPVRRPIETTPSLRVSVLHNEGSEVGAAAVSPDGRRIAYRARRADGMPMIWVRELDQSVSKPLPGTEDGHDPFWSPDSRGLGFFVYTTLKRISVDGGPVQVLARPAAFGGTWGRGDVILYGALDANIMKTDASGGPASPATNVPSLDWGHYWPSFLPDGRHFLFTVKQWTASAESSQQGVYLGSLDEPSKVRRLLPDLTSAVYARPGYLVFLRNGQLMAMGFEAGAGQFTTDAMPLGEAVAQEHTRFLAALSGGGNGVIAIRPAPAPALGVGLSATIFEGDLRVLDRKGSVLSTVKGSHLFGNYLAVSPNGRQVATNVQDPRTSTEDIWLFDLQSGSSAPITATRATGGWVGSAAGWSADEAHFAYACQPPGSMDDICVKDLRNGTVTQAPQTKIPWEHPIAWSPDGQSLLVIYRERIDTSPSELRVYSTNARTLSPYLKTAGNVLEGVFSPDGRFVAYSSDETGRWEVSVTTFPEQRQTWPLTTEGARVLSWSADAREIMVATLSGHIAAYPVTIAGGEFTHGQPQILARNVGFDAPYARPTRDHSRIVVRVPKDVERDSGEIRLLFGWTSGLNTRREK